MHRLPPWARPIATSVMAVVCLTSALSAQQGGDRTPRGDSLRQALSTPRPARSFRKLIDNAPDPSRKKLGL